MTCASPPSPASPRKYFNAGKGYSDMNPEKNNVVLLMGGNLQLPLPIMSLVPGSSLGAEQALKVCCMDK